MLTPKDYREAINVQDACNLSGVVHSFAAVLPRIWEQVRAAGLGTDAANKHPITVMYASKLASLTNCEDYAQFSAAYDACKRDAADVGSVYDAQPAACSPPENAPETSLHRHVWGSIVSARFTGNPHRKCSVPGCNAITMDLSDPCEDCGCSPCLCDQWCEDCGGHACECGKQVGRDQHFAKLQ